jgi:acetate kinase
VKVLVVNAGSSTLKASIFVIGNDILRDAPTKSDQIDWASTNFDATADEFLARLCADDKDDISIVGHRIVHGGTRYSESSIITDETLAHLRQLIELAPVHQPANIAGIEAAQRAFPDALHVAVFDTAFHSSMPELATVYAGPYEWYQQLGIRRFGFHGISHRYCAGRAAQLLGRELSDLRMITCHLGNGCSLCAVKNGTSQMTTMGYTPLEGLIMGTRSGSIDPGVLSHLIAHGHLKPEDISDVLNKRSGLLGISGIASDMRTIQQAAKQGHQRAQLAFDMFTRSLSSHICSLLPWLGGLDCLIFTGGIGEHSAAVRAAAASDLKCIGVEIDGDANEKVAGDCNISAGVAQVQTLVIHTREDFLIASDAFNVAGKTTTSPIQQEQYNRPPDQ